MNRKNKNLLDIIPLYSPRTTCNRMKLNDDRMIADMTLNFDKITISLLKEQFLKKDGNLKLSQFIITAKRHLKFWQPNLPNRDQSLVKYLAQLFKQIDINGNGDLQWKQFTSYIIEKATVLKNLKTKLQEIKRYVKSQVQPKIKIDGMIQKAQYIKDFGKVAFFEEGKSVIYFMDANDASLTTKPLQIDPKKLVITISSVKKNKMGKVQIRKKDMQIPSQVRVLDMLYLDDKKYKILLVSTSDGYVRGWKFATNGFVLATQPDNQEQLFEHYFNSQIYCLAWDNVNEVLYCGQKNGNIYMWNLKTDLQKTLFQSNSGVIEEQDVSQQKINLLITSMITMPKLQFMASGRMDGKLILWDTINHKKKWTYKQHTRGILTLAFNQSMILLFSAGFDHKICIWNPYIATLIHKIQSHLAPILTLRIIQNSNQLISMDSEGVVKITDTRRFHMIYSFAVEKQQNHQVNGSGSNNSNLSSFMVIDKPLKLLFIGKSISIYQYDKNYNPHNADENIVVACYYIKQMLSFITAAGNRVKIWSALNGDIDKIYIDITSYEITALALDSLKKRMILGDCAGNLSVHNVLNGAKLKSLTKHNTEIASIISMKRQTQMIITCSLDNQIRIFKEDDDNYEVVRFIYFRKDIQITTLNYQPFANFIIVGTNVGTVGFYDIQTGKNVGNCLNNNYDEITSLANTNHSVMVTTTSVGKIHLYLVPPLSNKFQRLVTLCHKDCEKEDDSSLGIRASAFSKRNNFLYVVDDKMYLTCYDLSPIETLKSDIKQANNQTQKIIQIFKSFQKLKFLKKWECKTNHEIIKGIDIIEQENILVTNGFDKKVKFWKAHNGHYIDSLQQNYAKCCPEPIAYYDMRNQILYSKNKKESFANVDLDTKNIQHDCSQIVQLQKRYPSFQKVCSNRQWNLHVEFNNDYLQRAQQTKKLLVQILNTENEIAISENSASIHKVNKKQIISNLEQTKNYLRMLRKELNKDENQISQTNFYPSKLKKKQTMVNKGNSNVKKSFMLKRLQSCQGQNHQSLFSNQNTEKPKLARKMLNSKDYTSICDILVKQQRNKDYEDKHKAFIDSLYKKQTESMMNGKKQQQIYMSRQEVGATKKLCKVLMEIDNEDKRPKCLLRRIKLKQSTQSMHITTSQFPKI